MSQHNELGVKGEILAIEFLEKKGYSILEINWHFEKTEVDIIAKDRNNLVIVEVKTRTTDAFGQPEESVGKAKQDLLSIAAEEYLERNNLDLDVRFDIIAVLFKNDQAKVYHIEDAFFPFE
jgi:putative endonuclease